MSIVRYVANGLDKQLPGCHTAIMQPSVFTKIINGDISCHKVYEDEHVLAFLDINPIQPGHTLVVPKKQVEFLWDLDDATYQALMTAVKKIAVRLRITLPVPYVGVQVVGIDVPHAHVHLVPFTTVEEFRSKPNTKLSPDQKALAEIASKVQF